MRAQSRSRRSPLPRLILGVLVVALVLSWPGIPAGAADARLERAQSKRQEVQTRLDGLVRRLSALQSEVAEVEERLAALRAAEASAAQKAEGATASLSVHARASYKRGTTDPLLSLFSSGSPQEAAEQARLLALLAKRSRSEFEAASAARVVSRSTAEDVERAARDLHARTAELDAVRGEVATLLAQARQQESQIQQRIAQEQAAARAKRVATAPRAARRTSRSIAGVEAPAAAPVAGGIACPVGNPRSYSDTWGAPRSGGRSHKGTDILAPRGTGIYAYENGTITRLTNSSLGGISLYMRGASGNAYYYTHLQGYVSGLRQGQSVSAGQQVGYNGDTGNARGTPHLHFEVMPGGGGNTNPYPYVKRACG
jgi:murein DD-endopeptidase MepM/ murein hydrolase activator NlpD